MEKMILDFLDGVKSIDFNFVWSLFGFALLVFWVVVLYWVWLDSGDRTSSRKMRVAYVLLTALLFVPGLIIYLLIRPSQTVEEIYWADLERRYLKYETAELGDCPKCGTQLFPGFTYCPNCRLKLKVKCPSCQVEMDKHYLFCPSCGNEMRKKSIPADEKAPSKEVMEEQIQASKEEATEVVESNRVRYSAKKGFAVKIGDGLIDLYKGLFGKSKSDSVQEEKQIKNSGSNKPSKKKKNSKRQR